MAQDMLSKARGLLDTAESYQAQGNAEAAATYRAKAEALMQKYRLSQEDMIAKDPTSLLPVSEDVVLAGSDTEFVQEYVNLFYVIAQHAGIRTHFTWRNRQVVAEAVGYESDIRYAEIIFTAARLVFAERLEPKVDPNLSDQVNVYRLRSAGLERVRVADRVWGNRDKANLSKVGRLYKAECAARGEQPALDGRGVTGKVYREQYATEFVWSLSGRLRRAQDAAGQYGGGLVLHGRKERVDEAFYQKFPSYRPSTEVATQCAKCTDDKKCKDHRPRAMTKADLARYARYNSAAAQRGRAAGTAASREVALDRAGREQVERGTTPAPSWMLGN